MTSTPRKRILFCLCGDARKASSRVRGYWVAEELERQGCSCTIMHDQTKLGLIRLAAAMPRHDVIVFQKTYSRYHRGLIHYAKHLGKRVYLDIDDAPSRIQSPTTLMNCHRMMAMSDGVLAGCEALREYASQFQSNSYLIPSSIKLELYNPSTELVSTSDYLTLGWIGNGPHYREDLLTILAPPLREVAALHPCKLKLIGTKGDSAIHDAFSDVPGLTTEFIDDLKWEDPTAIADALANIDIGLYPLLDNAFNHYKCGFKALEYMAMGIPVIASPVGANSNIVESGQTGILAGSSSHWRSAMTTLLADATQRRKLGDKGRQVVEQRYSTHMIAANISANMIMGLS